MDLHYGTATKLVDKWDGNDMLISQLYEMIEQALRDTEREALKRALEALNEQHSGFSEDWDNAIAFAEDAIRALLPTEESK